MSGPILLDTCAVIWTANGDALAGDAESALQSAYETDSTVWISPFTAWEVAMLVQRGRMSLNMSTERWFDAVLDTPGVALAPLTPIILIGSASLPGEAPADPADRIMIATARETGARLMTRDRKILSYADAGHVAALAC